MRALELREAIGPDGLVATSDAAVPDDDGTRVLIDVAAAGVTYPDLLVTQGRYQHRPELPHVPGLEVAGRVRRAPAGSRFAVGDRVAAACMGGGYAEIASADPRLVVRIPDALDDAAASGLVVNYQTMHFGLHRRGRLRAGETVVVLGAGGGIGVAAIQLARAAGAEVVAVCRGSAKAEVCRQAGASTVLDAAAGPVDSAAILVATGVRGADVVVDPVGGGDTADALRILRPEGRLLIIGFVGGIPAIAANRLLFRNVDAVGVAWGAFLEHDPGLASVIGAEIERLADVGAIAPPVGAVWDLADGAEALRALERREVVGRAVLRVTD